jgi:hypothetical protein
MAAIDFPSGAVLGDRFTSSTKTWEFDGAAWNLIVSTLQIPLNSIDASHIVNDSIVNADISTTAGIALSKLASGTAGNILVYDSSGVLTSVAETGDVTVSDAGVTAIGASKVTSSMIVDGTIVNGDISATAAINTTKITNWENDQVVLSQRIFA